MPPRVLYVVTEDWYFANHRLDHARALVAAGFEVHVATRVHERGAEIEAAGCTLWPVELERALQLTPATAAEVLAVRRIIAAVDPEVVHAVALKPVAVCLALLEVLRRQRFVFAISGLGIAAVERGPALRAYAAALRAAARSQRVRLVFQNDEDANVVGARADHVVHIAGVGVDTARFAPTPLPPAPPWRLAYLGRPVRSKGLGDLVEVAARPSLTQRQVRFVVHLADDHASPGAIDAAERARMTALDTIEVYGPTDDAPGVLATVHVGVLPSLGGEGISKFSLEVGATARPMITTRTPGNDAVVAHGVNGLLYPPGDVDALEAAIVELVDAGLDSAAAMGAAGRDVVEQRYSLDVILPQVVALHRELVDGPASASGSRSGSPSSPRSDSTCTPASASVASQAERSITRVAVVGSSGRVGRALAAALARSLTVVDDITRAQLDAARADAVAREALVERLTDVDVVVNLAGVAHLVGADARGAAHDALVAANVDLPAELAALCVASSTHLVHLSSTKAVPRGRRADPYGTSKRAGERAVAEVFARARHTVGSPPTGSPGAGAPGAGAQPAGAQPAGAPGAGAQPAGVGPAPRAVLVRTCAVAAPPYDAGKLALLRRVAPLLGPLRGLTPLARTRVPVVHPERLAELIATSCDRLADRSTPATAVGPTGGLAAEPTGVEPVEPMESVESVDVVEVARDCQMTLGDVLSVLRAPRSR